VRKNVGSTRRHGVKGLAAVVAIVSAIGVTIVVDATNAAAANRQEPCSSIYGCPPTTPPPGPQVSCSISAEAAAVGDPVIVTVVNVVVGTEISLSIDGVVIAKSTATADGQGNQTAAALAPAGHLAARAAELGGAVIKFTVPSSLSPGKHTLVVFGAGFSCSPTANGFAVLGSEVTRGELPRSDSGSLARTGLQIALFLAIALVLILAGYMLVKEAQRRRRRRAREQNRIKV